MTEIILTRSSGDRHILSYSTIDCVLCYKSPIHTSKGDAGSLRTNAKTLLQSSHPDG